MAEARMAAGKRVQELAEHGGEPPTQYIQREADRPVDRSPPLPSVDIPIVDLRLLSGGDGAELAKLRSALHSWGMFQAVGHGMPDGFLGSIREMAREFFALPAEEKMRYCRRDGDQLRPEGYGNDEVRFEGQILDWSDRLYLKVQPEDQRMLDLWPETPTCFRDNLHEYAIKVRSAIGDTLRGIARVLGLQETHFIHHLGDHLLAFARFNYYPRCSRPHLVFGIKPHTDATVLTAVLQDPGVDGLQLLCDSNWVKVPVVPHALLINLGDLMEIMSNGILKSPVHRVVANPEKERISMALFFGLQPEEEVEPTMELVGDGRSQLYKKMRVKDYLEVFFKNFAQGKISIEYAKV